LLTICESHRLAPTLAAPAWPLQPGTHAVKLSAGGLSREIAVEIRRGQTHSELVDLRKR